jgi:hypothetical protein
VHKGKDASCFAISNDGIAKVLRLDEIGEHSLSGRNCSATETAGQQVSPQIRMLLERNAEQRLIDLNNLGQGLYSQGRYKEIEAIHIQVLAGREKILGTEHSDTITSVSNLALALYS